MVALQCQQFTAPIFALFRKEEVIQKKINNSQTTKQCTALTIKYQHLNSQISSLLYHQEKCDDHLFNNFSKGLR
jgi:hypothetical protein